jgi:TatD DNase family protein
VPLDRIVLETDAPYMAPVPQRGQRNESAYIRHVITRLAEAYGVSEEEICQKTNENVQKVFGIQI